MDTELYRNKGVFVMFTEIVPLLLLTPTLLQCHVFLAFDDVGHSLTELFPLWTMAKDVCKVQCSSLLYMFYAYTCRSCW